MRREKMGYRKYGHRRKCGPKNRPLIECFLAFRKTKDHRWGSTKEDEGRHWN